MLILNEPIKVDEVTYVDIDDLAIAILEESPRLDSTKKMESDAPFL